MIGCVAACVTCCIAALPYIGTVILLPVVMFLFMYPLCFIRQFGDRYDVWAVVRPTEPRRRQIPPVQDTLTADVMDLLHTPAHSSRKALACPLSRASDRLAPSSRARPARFASHGFPSRPPAARLPACPASFAAPPARFIIFCTANSPARSITIGSSTRSSPRAGSRLDHRFELLSPATSLSAAASSFDPHPVVRPRRRLRPALVPAGLPRHFTTETELLNPTAPFIRQS